ncbi:MAG TPA: DUF5717 family protein [Lachnospiraceae bacterium]
MRKRIEQLLEETYEYDVPSLLVSEDKIIVRQTKREQFRGELTLKASDGSKIRGSLYGNHRRLVLGRDIFYGEIIKIPYGFETSGLIEGDRVEGELTISANLGEYTIPFSLEIIGEGRGKNSGDFLNLDEFVVRAKKNYEEAYQFFEKGFSKSLFGGSDRQYLGLYESLSGNYASRQNMEEFLVTSQKKERVKIHLEDDKKSFYGVGFSTKNILKLHKENWGYFKADILVEGDFIVVEKRQVGCEDFIGSVYGLEYIIKKERLSRGKKYGRIIIKTPDQTLSFMIMASLEEKARVNMDLIDRHNKFDLAEGFLSYLLHPEKVAEWSQKTLEKLEEMKEKGLFFDTLLLYEAYVYYIRGMREECTQIIKRFSKRVFTDGEWELAAFYLYVGYISGVLSAEKGSIPARLGDMAERQPKNFWILWMYIKASENLSYSPAKKLFLLEKQFEQGARSPFVYYEAYQVIQEEITKLNKMSSFFKQVLLFAIKYKQMTLKVALRVANLANYEKSFDKITYKILVESYRKFPADEILEAICKVIMRGDPLREEYFKWYSKAVERELKIPKLYECYMETVEENYQKQLPIRIRHYFSYGNLLSDKKKAYLYANIIANKNLDEETYEQYQEQMRRFAIKKLAGGRLNQNYAILYQNFIQKVVDRNMGEDISKVLFAYRLYCEDKRIKSVIVRHEQFVKEQEFECVDGVAYILIYTKNATILFQDEDKNRYSYGIAYNLQKLFDGSQIMLQCQRLGVRAAGFLLAVCEDGEYPGQVTRESITSFQKVLDSHAFVEEYKESVKERLLNYYVKHSEDESLNDYLKQIKMEDYKDTNKALLLEILISSAKYGQAFDLATTYGYESVAIDKLLRLCSRIITKLDFALDEELLYMTHFIYRRGKYDEVMLTYLVRYFKGQVKEMCRIWESAQKFGIEDFSMTKRILLRSMFTRKHPAKEEEIFKAYLYQGGSETIIMAYLSFVSYSYFLEDYILPAFLGEYIGRVYARGAQINKITKIALLKYYGEEKQEKLLEIEKVYAKEILEKLQKEGIRLSLYQKLPKEILEGYQLEDKTFVEQRAFQKDRVTLYYTLEKGNKEGNVFMSEPLKNSYLGLFSKEFILLYGEELNYYFTIEHDGKLIKTKEKKLVAREIKGEGFSKFEQINTMLDSYEKGQWKQLEQQLYRYFRYEAVSKKWFLMMGGEKDE